MQKSSKTRTDEKQEREKRQFIEDTVRSVSQDFEERRKKRVFLERQWQLNMNFLSGNQFCGINGKGEIIDEISDFFWKENCVFNHIAPIIESRLAKFSKITCDISVRPKTEDNTDIVGADVAKKAITEVFQREKVIDTIKKTTLWSETCGSGFYKVIWDNNGGNQVGITDDIKVYEGEVNILPVSPFEVFPDNLYVENIEDCFSIIHARGVSVREIREKYGVEVKGEEVDVFDLKEKNTANNMGERENRGVLKDSAIVIEKYERPSREFPNGRLITVANNQLLYYGELPYMNGENKTRTFPFIKQDSMPTAGNFFGSSVIERLIPVQRAYNAVKNRKHEFLNRLTNGIMMVEDGSLDVDDLQNEGLAPGKVLVYRQGSKLPEMLSPLSLPSDFADEENKLLNEFVSISGVSDVSSSSSNAKLSSGSALQLLIEQDNERLLMSAERIRKCYLLIAKHVIRLYSQFLAGVRVINFSDKNDKTHTYYLDKNAVNSDMVYFERENQIFEGESSKKETVFKLLDSGLLSDENGNIRQSVKEKVLSIIGYKDLASQKGLSYLQEEKAQNENIKIRTNGLDIEEIDDDTIHIDEHLRYVFAEYDELTVQEKQRLFNHIKNHKERLKQNQKEQ